MYKIKTINTKADIMLGEKANIDVYNWGGTYRPKAYGIVCYLKEEGFFVHMECEETSPLATYEKQNSNVCKDSCLEFFCIPVPNNDKKDIDYVNLECNAKGSLLCCIGKIVNPRKTIMELGFEHPKAIPFQTKTTWGYEVLLPLSLIKNLYGQDITFKTGDIITGNFFKCGDKTEIPHFGSYTKIEVDYPSFHQPKFFAQMQID